MPLLYLWGQNRVEEIAAAAPDSVWIGGVQGYAPGLPGAPDIEVGCTNPVRGEGCWSDAGNPRGLGLLGIWINFARGGVVGWVRGAGLRLMDPCGKPARGWGWWS
ncbi:hypothetical protein, partial [Actinomadura hibisca]|uniref:hypothetical protein n=1 Tax=Actinomadura hibisca TaxID=68565 RepID=UPI001C3F3AFB